MSASNVSVSEQLRLFRFESEARAFDSALRRRLPRAVSACAPFERTTRNLLDGDPLSGYISENVDPEHWSNIEQPIRDFCLVALPKTTNPHVVVRSVITRFVYWAWKHGFDTSIDALLDPLQIEPFLDEQDDLSDSTKGNYRAILRQVGYALIGPPKFMQSVPRASSRLQLPYTDDEISALYSWVSRRRASISKSRLTVLMACSLGAGLLRGEILNLSCGDVEIYPDSVRINVKGDRSRSVWVDRLWESIVAEEALLAGDGSIMCLDGKTNRQRDKTMSNLVAAKHRYPGMPEFSVTRFRCTWMVGLLDRGVPPRLVADAAGVTTDQIGQYIEFTAEYDDADVRGYLRGEC